MGLSPELIESVSEYVESCYRPSLSAIAGVGVAAAFFSGFSAANYSDIIGGLEDSFSSMLVKFIRDKNLANTEVYKEANLDRRLFSKIISNDGYAPTKSTALALSIALRLNLDETSTLLKSAGFALSHSSKSDLVVEYFIKHGGKDYNIFTINDVLQELELPQIGSRQF